MVPAYVVLKITSTAFLGSFGIPEAFQKQGDTACRVCDLSVDTRYESTFRSTMPYVIWPNNPIIANVTTCLWMKSWENLRISKNSSWSASTSPKWDSPNFARSARFWPPSVRRWLSHRTATASPSTSLPRAVPRWLGHKPFRPSPGLWWHS